MSSQQNTPEKKNIDLRCGSEDFYILDMIVHRHHSIRKIKSA